MSFKEQLKEDIVSFINKDEFADMHSINGNEIECIVISADKDVPLQYMEGTSTSYKSLIIPVSFFDVAPMPNDYLNLDGTLFKVSTSSNDGAIAYIDLGLPVAKFDKDIQIYYAKAEEKGGGYEEIVLGDLFTECKAYIRHQSGDELFKLNTVLEKSQTIFKIPYVLGLEKSMILVYKDKHYDIKHIDNIEENNVFIDLVCEAVE